MQPPRRLKACHMSHPFRVGRVCGPGPRALPWAEHCQAFGLWVDGQFAMALNTNRSLAPSLARHIANAPPPSALIVAPPHSENPLMRRLLPLLAAGGLRELPADQVAESRRESATRTEQGPRRYTSRRVGVD
jgi:hypothetical protein